MQDRGEGKTKLVLTIFFGFMFWLGGPFGTFYIASRDTPLTDFDRWIGVFFSLFWLLPLAMMLLAAFLAVALLLGSKVISAAFPSQIKEKSLTYKLIATVVGIFILIFILPFIFRIFGAGVIGVLQGVFSRPSGDGYGW